MTADQLMDLHRQHLEIARSGYFESPHNEAPGRQRGKRQRCRPGDAATLGAHPRRLA